MTESVYTANDEEPKCGRCDNICESDELCIKRCGPEHCWGGYIRTVNEQEGGDDHGRISRRRRNVRDLCRNPS